MIKLLLLLLVTTYSFNAYAADDEIYLDFPDNNKKLKGNRLKAINDANAQMNTNSSNTGINIDPNHLKQHQHNININVQPSSGQGSIQAQPIMPTFPTTPNFNYPTTNGYNSN